MNNPLLAPILVIVGGLVTIFFFAYLFSGGNRKNNKILAIDGTEFFSEEECNEYNFLYERFICSRLDLYTLLF